MKTYEKPMVINSEEVAESVYMASGGSECYTVNAYIHQVPQQGRGDYRIQLNAAHAASDGHHSGEQVLTISFNQPVEYSGSNGTLVSGSGTATLNVKFNYHSNGNDNIGLGELIVISDPGLAITATALGCNHDCGQH